MDTGVRGLAAKAEGLNSISGTYMVERGELASSSYPVTGIHAPPTLIIIIK